MTAHIDSRLGWWSSLLMRLTSPATRLRVSAGIVRQAIQGAPGAIDQMFATFLPPGEAIMERSYLGIRGIPGFGHHCWACVTDRRFAAVFVGPMRSIEYRDIAADRINVLSYRQPSAWVYLGVALPISAFLMLYPIAGVIAALEEDSFTWPIGWIIFTAAGLLSLLLPFLAQAGSAIARRFIKRGFECRGDSAQVDVFCDPNYAAQSMRLMHAIADLRERRFNLVGQR